MTARDRARLSLPALAHALGPLDAHRRRRTAPGAAGSDALAPTAVSVFAPAPTARPWSLWRDAARRPVARALVRGGRRRSGRSSPRPRFAIAGATRRRCSGRCRPRSTSRPARAVGSRLRTGRALSRSRPDRAVSAAAMGPDGDRRPRAEWLESPRPARAAICARGIFGTGAGPRSAGTARRGSCRRPTKAIRPAHRIIASGGPASLAGASRPPPPPRAPRSGPARRSPALMRDDNGRVPVSSLDDGEQIRAGVVVSNADPERTLLGLVDPVRPAAVVPHEGPRTSGRRGVARQGQPRAGAPAGVPRRRGRRRLRSCSQAAFTSAPTSTTWSGPSTRRSTARSRPSPGSKSPFPHSVIRRWRRRDSM